MWQRIQTIYLTLVVILSCSMFFVPIAGFFNTTNVQVLDLYFSGVYLQNTTITNSFMPMWALTALTATIPLIALATIFMYKKRIIQLRLNVFNILLMLGYYAMLFLYLWVGKEKLQADWFLYIPSSFPLINIVFSILAIRGILKDEAKIRALNRLR